MLRSRSACRVGGLSEDGRETSMSDSVHGTTISDSSRSAAEPGMLGGILAGCGRFVLMLSLQPFAGVPEQTVPGESTGNIVNVDAGNAQSFTR